MEVFKALMGVNVSLVVFNLLLAFVVWRATKFPSFLVFMSYWSFSLVAVLVQTAFAKQDPFIRMSAVIIPNFCLHFSLCFLFAGLLDISFPLKKWIVVPFLEFTLMVTIKILHDNWGPMPSEVWPLPLTCLHAFMYFYVVYQALRYRRSQMTFGLWIYSTIITLYALHLLDYSYFYTRLEWFGLAFTATILFSIAIAIVVPMVIIEKMLKDKARLEAEVFYKNKMMNSARMAALGEMAGGVAHEINTPLNILVLLTERIKEASKKHPSGQEISPLVDKCLDTVDRIANIIKSLLAFSLEDKKQENSLFDANNLVQDTVILCSEKMKAHGIDLQVKLHKAPLMLNGHRGQLSQVLMHLLSNAFDALKGQSGTKRITVKVQESLPNSQQNENQPWVCLSVADTGPGLTTEAKEKLFQPFFTTKELNKGTGLGLSLSKGIVELHGGSISLDSSQNERSPNPDPQNPNRAETKFLITLPLAKAVKDIF